MNNQVPQLSFETWLRRLHPSPLWASQSQRSGESSTSIDFKPVPVSIQHWDEFPRWMIMWRGEMLQRGLGSGLFEELAQPRTRHYTRGMLFGDHLRHEGDTTRSLHEYFNMVNDFNLSFYQLLEPDLPPIPPYTDVITAPTVSLNVVSKADMVITDGSYEMKKVGLGEIKPPWVVQRGGIVNFMNRLPISHFGVQFIAHFTNKDHKDPAILNVGKAVTEIYSDLLTDGLSLGFLATIDSLIVCFIPPEDRTCLKVYFHPIYRQERPWEFMPGMPTVQVSLMTLAWMGKTQFSGHQKHPGSRIWGNTIGGKLY
jgi:hypothetical protein